MKILYTVMAFTLLITDGCTLEAVSNKKAKRTGGGKRAPETEEEKPTLVSDYVLSEYAANLSNNMSEMVGSTYNLIGSCHNEVLRYLLRNLKTSVSSNDARVINATLDRHANWNNRYQSISTNAVSSTKNRLNTTSLPSLKDNESIQLQRLLEENDASSPYLNASRGGTQVEEKGTFLASNRDKASNAINQTKKESRPKTKQGGSMVEEIEKRDTEKSGAVNWTSSITSESENVRRVKKSKPYFDDGVLDLQPRIIGGEDATIEEFPFMVSMRRDWCCHHCGGVLVTASWLLTAGHCLLKPSGGYLVLTKPEEWFVLAGATVITDNNTARCEPNQEKRDVVELRMHPQFFLGRLLNDMGMVRLALPLPSRREIRPATLPSDILVYDKYFTSGTPCVVAGWGSTMPFEEHEVVDRDIDGIHWRTCDTGRRSFLLPHLQMVQLPLLYWKRCAEIYDNWLGGITEEATLCTLSEEGKDSCDGDSGGPLICHGLVVGIMSWGGGECAKENVPAVYARIDYSIKWIKRTMVGERSFAAALTCMTPAVVKMVVAMLTVSIS